MKVLNFDGTIYSARAGTAALPGISFANDPNTGIYSPGADQVAISTNGTGRLFVNSSGLISMPVGTVTLGTAATTNAVINSPDNIYINIDSDNSTTNRNFVIGKDRDTESGGTELFRIQEDGKLGLGTSSPLAELHLNDATGVSRIRLTGGAAGADNFEIGQAITGVSNSGFSIYDVDAAATRFVIDSSGNVGIGTTSPAKKLDVYEASTGNVEQYLRNTAINLLSKIDGTTSAQFGTETSHPLLFLTGNTERASIDTSGRLLVGTSTARTNVDGVAPAVQVEGTTESTAGTSIIRNSASGGGPLLFLGKSRSASVGGNTVVNSDDTIGTAAFAGNDGTNFITAATISAQVDGTPAGPTPGPVSMPGRLVFSTTANGASSPTERMRIDSAGDVFIGWTGFFGSNNNKGLGVRFSSATGSGGEGGTEIYNSSTDANSSPNPPLLIIKGVNDTTSANRFIQFYANNTTAMGGIVGNGASNVQFASLSDERDKKNVEPLIGAAQKIQQLNVVSFDWKSGGGHVDAGFIAQNVETVFPEYVLENVSDGDAEPRKGITGGMSAGYVAVLTAALQEALAEIESLKARVTALEP